MIRIISQYKEGLTTNNLYKSLEALVNEKEMPKIRQLQKDLKWLGDSFHNLIRSKKNSDIGNGNVWQ
ncbi:MAG: hypothetical protein Q9M28_10070, partial [Mariprofundaceae bacterium]|nr:hypothetical protein [Mariprofundaceae bacterium]